MLEKPHKYAFVIPHCFLGEASQKLRGSSRLGIRDFRRSVLDQAIFQIHSLFGQRYATLDCATMKNGGGANPFGVEFEIFVFTTGGFHFVEELETYPHQFEHIETEVEPLFLGFECARWTSRQINNFDYFFFLEDDLIIRDQTFLKKVDYFNALTEQAVPNALLQPQRYELAINTKDKRTLESIDKLYIDYQDSDKERPSAPILNVDYMNMEIELEPTSNPHAGCYLITSEQADRMCAHPDFLDPNKIYISHLDTAATAFVARTHTIYKPSYKNPSFFEIEHGHQTCLRMSFDWMDADDFEDGVLRQ